MPDRTGIFAAVTGVDHHGHQAIDNGRRRLGRLTLGTTGRVGAAMLLEQGQQGIGGLGRIEVEHQPVTVFADRLEAEHLRLHLALEFDDQAHHAGLEAAGADQANLRIVVENLAGQALQHRVEFDALRGR